MCAQGGILHNVKKVIANKICHKEFTVNFLGFMVEVVYNTYTLQITPMLWFLFYLIIQTNLYILCLDLQCTSVLDI